MTVMEHDHQIIKLAPFSNEIIESYTHLVADPYMGNANRFRRFSQYRMSFNERWSFEKLEHRPYMTFSKYNPVAGGIKRFYEPLEVDFTPYIEQAATCIPLDPSHDWQINVHQYRVIVTPSLEGITVPEGRHRDGHSFVMIGVVKREGIQGAVMKLYRTPQDTTPFYVGTVWEGQAALLNDQTLLHDVTEITALEETGYRDIFVVAFSPWAERWHGEEFENKVIESTTV
ncbi:2OG-Fe dioxygenase family protein [Pseudomonas sp. TCU-HL1]|uniref:2OG-Fe dioxygenase family protein n=1 Tax=Pseudomonas sp. TCU-HL1 TaxID=1856685 RepID=UPI00083DE8FD|nr:2OG-Fe dioxygenase family protein [Pseudomonas sp. TCU-HL1]AOE82955.1 hypothetical protein THL1_407 [Pseudomonas sp. TCU-HL1]